MLELKVVLEEFFDEENDNFIENSVIMKLEHSLLAISKWEFIYEKPFLQSDKTDEELFTYFKCMALEDYPDHYYTFITSQQILEVNAYCNKKGTATWFSEEDSKTKESSEIVTAELIYYWMLSNNIPKDFENWYIHRLLTLIRVFSVKNSPPKKMSQEVLRNRYREINEKRLAAMRKGRSK